MIRQIVTMALALCVGSLHTAAQQVTPFKAGDRVAFVGNSITDGGHYHSYIWLYYMTHFPNERMWMANCGIGGDECSNILARLDDDVFLKRPNVLTLSFGMNDSGYFEYNGDNPGEFADSKVANSRKYFLEIEKRLKEATDIRKVMIGTSPYDQTSTFNDNVFRKKNDAIRRIIAFQDSAARADHWEFVDFNAPMLRINEEQQAKDPTFTICGNDRVHPDNDGHMVMAYIFLKAQGMVGKPVADVQIDARSKKVVRSVNCTVSDLTAGRRELSFSYLAESLPYPLDTIAHGWGFKRPQAQAVKMVPSLVRDISNEQLKITGLKGNYRLTIDGVVIDTITAQRLAQGVNLAEYRHTPQYQQACAVMALNEDRWELERKFRDYGWLQYDFFMKKGLLHANDEHAARVFRDGETKDGWVAARRDIYDKMIHKDVRDAYTAMMDLLVDKIYSINKPVTRRFVLTAVK